MRRLVLLLAWAWPAAAQEMPRAPVVVAEVVEREVVARRGFVGAVAPVRRTTVGSEVEGLVTEYVADEGQRVEAGAPLARLRTRLVEIRLAGAKAELGLRQEELRELRNGSRPEEVEQSRARVASARAAHELRQWRLERAQQLFDSSVISEDELKEAGMTARLADELLKEVEAGARLVEAGPREERIAQAEARVAAQEAEVARLAEELDRHTIRAPFTGYVVAEHTEVGAWLGKGTGVADLVALDEVDIVAPVVEDYVLALEPGMAVSVTVGAIPGRTFEGTLAAVVPEADARARTFPVKVRVKNEAGEGRRPLKAGMFATIHLPVGKPERSLLVPKDAIVLGGPAPVVVVALDDGSVRFVPVETGVSAEGLVAVKGALAAGEKVVVRGNERLRPDQKVRIEGPAR